MPSGSGLSVVLAVTDVVRLLGFAVNQALRRKQVVHNFAVLLLLFHAVRQRVVAHQLVDDGFKHDMKALYQQILALFGIDIDLPATSSSMMASNTI